VAQDLQRAYIHSLACTFQCTCFTAFCNPVARLNAFLTLQRTPGVELLIAFGLFGIVGLASLRWGADSRESLSPEEARYATHGFDWGHRTVSLPRRFRVSAYLPSSFRALGARLHPQEPSSRQLDPGRRITVRSNATQNDPTLRDRAWRPIAMPRGRPRTTASSGRTWQSTQSDHPAELRPESSNGERMMTPLHPTSTIGTVARWLLP
jgi:hypothetical protein